MGRSVSECIAIVRVEFPGCFLQHRALVMSQRGKISFFKVAVIKLNNKMYGDKISCRGIWESARHSVCMERIVCTIKAISNFLTLPSRVTESEVWCPRNTFIRITISPAAPAQRRARDRSRSPPRCPQPLGCWPVKYFYWFDAEARDTDRFDRK